MYPGLATLSKVFLTLLPEDLTLPRELRGCFEIISCWGGERRPGVGSRKWRGAGPLDVHDANAG
jgi:hypothetical protein